MGFDFNNDGKTDGRDYAFYEEFLNSNSSSNSCKPARASGGSGVSFILMIIVCSIIGCFSEILAVIILIIWGGYLLLN